jgi:hypothetical protein
MAYHDPRLFEGPLGDVRFFLLCGDGAAARPAAYTRDDAVSSAKLTEVPKSEADAIACFAKRKDAIEGRDYLSVIFADDTFATMRAIYHAFKTWPVYAAMTAALRAMAEGAYARKYHTTLVTSTMFQALYFDAPEVLPKHIDDCRTYAYAARALFTTRSVVYGHFTKDFWDSFRTFFMHYMELLKDKQVMIERNRDVPSDDDACFLYLRRADSQSWVASSEYRAAYDTERDWKKGGDAYMVAMMTPRAIRASGTVAFGQRFIDGPRAYAKQHPADVQQLLDEAQHPFAKLFAAYQDKD